MTRDAPTPLLAEFTVPTLQSWTAAAEHELRGRSLASLTWHTDDDGDLPPLFTRADTADLPHLAGGVLDAVMPADAWVIRQRITAADPRRAGQLCGQAIAGGADEILLRFDRLASRGADPGTLADCELEVDLFDVDAGLDGCAIYHVEDLGQVLAGIDLAHTRVALDPGSSALAALGMLVRIADRRGVDRTALRVELGLDPLRELVTGPTLAATTSDLLAETTSAVRASAGLPGVVPLAVHSAPYHHAGASPAQELACTIATAIAYLRQLPTPDPAALVLRMTVDTDLYVEIAKLRAARLLFAKVATGFGCAAVRIGLHAESSARSWSADDAHTNLVRSNVQALAASLAGCDSISLAPFEEHQDDRDRTPYRLARNQLLLLRYESMLQRVLDPTRGGYAIEALTDRIARQAWSVVQDIESRGGMLAALDDGSIQAQIAATAERRRYALAVGERVLVGTSRFVDPRFRRASAGTRDPEELQHRMFEFLAQRAPSDALVAGDDLESLVAAAGAGCTTGEITRALRNPHPIELERTFYEASPDGAPFEVLRDLVREAELVAQPLTVGDPQLARARYEFAREFFATAGITTREPVATAEAADEQARILVLCGDDAAVDALVPSIAGDRPLVVAGPRREAIEASVTTFIHRGCDLLSTARELFLEITGDQEDRP